MFFKQSSRYTGVWLASHKNGWRAAVGYKGKRIYLGCHKSEKDAAICVNEKCRELGIPLRNPDLAQMMNVTEFCFIIKVTIPCVGGCLWAKLTVHFHKRAV